MHTTLLPEREATSGRACVEPPDSEWIAVPEDARCSSILEAMKWRCLGWLGSTLRLDRFPASRLGRPNVLVQLGAGQDMHPDFVNSDFFHVPLLMRRPRPDWSMDITRPFRCPDRCVDGIFTQHTLEHISPRQVLEVLRECHRVLKPGACMRVVVPDAERYAMAVAGLGACPITAGTTRCRSRRSARCRRTSDTGRCGRPNSCVATWARLASARCAWRHSGVVATLASCWTLRCGATSRCTWKRCGEGAAHAEHAVVAPAPWTNSDRRRRRVSRPSFAAVSSM